MNVDHIGYAVKNIDASRQAFEELGYVFDPVVNDTDRNIFISFGRLGDYRIELVSPLDPALPITARSRTSFAGRRHVKEEWEHTVSHLLYKQPF